MFTKVCARQIIGIAPLFNSLKKHVLKYFALEMPVFSVVRRRLRREHRACCWRERIFSIPINLFGMPEEHIIWAYCLPSHFIFNLLQEIKDVLEPSTRSHAIPGLGLQTGEKCPVNFRNIPETLESFQYFLESSRNFWKVSGNILQI